MLQKIKNALYRFMYGRYGMDALNKALFIPIVVVFIINIFLTGIARTILMLVGWGLIIYMYFRMFSRNIAKRNKENSWFLGKVNYIKTRVTQSKNYRFYNCPKCGTHLRVPKGVGKITITCKKCGHKFDRKA